MSSPAAQPDGYFPGDAVNNPVDGGGFESYAATTQADYTDQLNAAALTPVAPLSNACNLLNGSPFASGVVNMGADSTPGETNGTAGNLVNGTQSLMDLICGVATGSPTAGTTPETIVTGLGNTQIAAANSPMTSGLITMGGPTAVPGSGVAGAGINGIQMFSDFLCGTGGAYGSVLTGRRQEIFHAMVAGAILGSGHASPQSIMQTTQGFVDATHGVLMGGSTTGNSVAGTIDAAQGIIGPNQSAVSMYANLLGFKLPFGQVPQSILGQVPASHIGSDTPNLLTNGNFDTEASLVDETGKWVWDGTAGHVTAGSAKCTADSTLHELLSNIVPVSKQQTIYVSCWASWNNLAGAGYPIHLDLECYKGASLVNTITIDMQDTGEATSEWIQMAGEYDIPSDDSIDNVCVRIAVTETASAGDIWFDDIECAKTAAIIHDAASGGNVTISSFPTLLDNLYNGMTGLENEAATHAQVYAAVASQTGTIVSNSAALAQIRGLLSPGVAAADDFERDPTSSLGANWDVGYTNGGYWECDGHNAVWLKVGPDECRGRCRWTGPNQHSSTDYQAIEAVMSSPPASSGLFGTPAASQVYGRMSDDGLNYIHFSIDGKGVAEISRWVGGVETVMATASGKPVPQAGSTIALRCGAPGAPRYFQALINGATVLEVTETGAASGFGVNYRGWGFGGWAGHENNVQTSPGGVNQWVAADQ